MPPRETLTTRRAPNRVTRRARGRGIGFESAGNTRLDIELKINGQLGKKISAVNTGINNDLMTFRVLNSDVTFNHFRNENYIEAFRRMFTRLTNASA